MSLRRLISIGLVGTAVILAQEAAPQSVQQVGQQPPQDPAQLATQPQPKPDAYTVAPGTRLPLSLINSVSTKHSQEGDQVYLETAFPILANGRIVIPVGSSVSGTITEIKKPGRVKGRGELYVRFDTLILPNGVTRDFRSRMGTVDASSTGNLDRAEGKIKSEGNKAGDARTIGETAATGASIGAIAGSVAGHTPMGLGIGAGVGAAAGLIGVLVTRGPDAVLAKGSTIEMVLDRPIHFTEAEVSFNGYQAPRMSNPVAQTPGPAPSNSPVPWHKD